jgi:hypothetical protein
MPTAATLHPGAQALMFRYRFKAGNVLRPTEVSQLRIEAEQHFDEIRMFLDAAGLVEGIDARAGRVDTNLSIGPAELSTDEVRAIPVVRWRREPASTAVGGTLGGVTLVLPAGTEIGLLPSPAGAAAAPVQLRFPQQTQIEIGSRGSAPLDRYNLRGVTPVLLDGNPLLEITQPQRASLDLHWHGASTAILSLLVIVSPYRRRGQDALYHVMEALGDRVVGGSSIQIRA